MVIRIHKFTQYYLTIVRKIFFFSGETSKDEPWAWEAREFLRNQLIGEEVLFTSEKPPNTNREYGTIYLGKGLLCRDTTFV